MMAFSPTIKLRNPANVIDDIPLYAFSVIWRHPVTDRYLVTSHVVFSSENGGMPAWQRLQLYDRPYDEEWAMQQQFEANGQLLPEFQLFQGSHHGVTPYDGQERFNGHPVIRVATPNNNFAADRRLRLGRIALPYSRSRQTNPVFYTPCPDFFVSNVEASQALLARPEIQQWSLTELGLEGCQIDSDQVQKALDQISPQLAGNFQPRCGGQQLRLPNQDR
jgi:hypothetical protein